MGHQSYAPNERTCETPLQVLQQIRAPLAAEIDTSVHTEDRSDKKEKKKERLKKAMKPIKKSNHIHGHGARINDIQHPRWHQPPEARKKELRSLI